MMSKGMERLWRVIFTILFKWVLNVQILYEKRIPMEGSYIIAPNHISLLDPPLVGLANPRPTYFMAKQELFKPPILGWLIRKLGAFPVARGSADKEAIKRAHEIVNRGDCLGMFPQGTRRCPDVFGKLKDGAASMALRTGVPIIPVYIHGSEKIRRSTIVVYVGEPLLIEKQVPTKEEIVRINNQIVATWERLRIRVVGGEDGDSYCG